MATRAGSVSLLQRCLRDPIGGPPITAFLTKFLPGNMIDRVRSDPSPAASLLTFDGESETPALVWHGGMRKELRLALVQQLEL
jgi:hypothetical protein